MLSIRPARPADIASVRDLFLATYGEHYGVREFYDTGWLTKAAYDDNTIFLVAEDGGAIVGSMSALLAIGDSDDLQALLGRLVTSPAHRSRGIGRALFDELLSRLASRAQFVFADARTAHDGSQKLCEAEGMHPVGFEPMVVSQMQTRESFAVYARLQGEAIASRRTGPRVVPEVAALARHSLHSLRIRDDVAVDDDSEGWPTGRSLALESLEDLGMAPLLRIERGRVKRRDVFGHLTLALGRFQIARAKSYYLLAREGGVVVGGVGFKLDEHDAHVRIFEVIGATDDTRGALLAAADRVAREHHGAACIDLDVSAYSPDLQRTLVRLGYVPVAYLPAMVFERGERLDVVRMMKLELDYDVGPILLRPAADAVRTIVEASFEGQRLTREAVEGMRHAAMFRDLAGGELAELARLAEVRTVSEGTVLLREGEPSEAVLVLLAGAAEVRSSSGRRARVSAGEIFGEMGLLERSPRSADIVATESSRVAAFDAARVERLIASQPRLGLTLMRSFVRALSEKVRERATHGGDVSC